nr:O-antigen ligase family protein [Patulibacter sp. SYSU D01012]
MAGGAAAARLAPGRWQAPLGGVLLGTTVICAVGLGSKVFPTDVPLEQVFARLQAPIGYWNGVGAIATFCLVLALWLGTRREGYRPLNATAYPIAALAVITLLQTYSRGALLAAAVGSLVWIVLAPRRLHSLLILVVGVLGGGFVGIWAFAKADLSTDRVVFAARETAGAEFGVLLLSALVFLLVIGLVVEFATVFAGFRTEERRRLGVVVAVAVALVPLAGVGVLATSERGLTGSITNAYKQLTDPTVALPSGDPSRLTEASSARSTYWRQGIDLFELQPTHGVGAGGFGAVQSRIRGATNGQVAKHAHGWIPQTLADLGWIGMAVQLALALAFVAAASRALGLWGPLRGGSRTAERDGVAAAVGVVAAFAVSSFADWTWFLPGVTVPVMLLAGWVVGRGAEAAFAGGGLGERPPLRLASPRTAVAVLAAAVTVAACVSITLPWRSERAQDAAFEALGANDVAAAERHAQDARDLDPLSTDARYVQASVRVRRGDVDGARRLYREAIDLEPAVPTTWQRLAEFELDTAERPLAALQAVGVALKMAPTSRDANLIAITATRRLQLEQAKKAGGEQAAAAAGGTAPGAAGAASTTTAPAAP